MPDKAVAQLRFYLQHAAAEEQERIVGSRFVLAQALAADGHVDEAAAELRAVRRLLVSAFGPESTQVRNLDKHLARLRTIPRE